LSWLRLSVNHTVLVLKDLDMGNADQEAQREENRKPQAGARRFQIRQQMVSIGSDFWIENEQGERVYKIDGKAMRIRSTLYFEDASGKQLAELKKHLVSFKETMDVTAPDGKQMAQVKKARITPLREHYVVKVKDGPDLEVHGNLFDHEYTIGEGHTKVAQVSKKYLHVRDSYSVSIEPGQDEVIILAVVVCIDEMAHSSR
jgi:uncharacterized protein YxjI